MDGLKLTRRQEEVLRNLLKAKQDKHIARELRVSIATVRMHLRHLFMAADVRDRLELAVVILGAVHGFGPLGKLPP